MRLALLLLALCGLAAAQTIANEASNALNPGFDSPIDPVGEYRRSHLSCYKRYLGHDSCQESTVYSEMVIIFCCSEACK